MILYKYVSLEAAIKIIDTSSIGFSNAENLNDDLECWINFSEPDSEYLTANVARDAFISRLSRKYGILSLTTRANNQRLWDEYADSTKGVAIGIDINAAGLDDGNSCLIPASEGMMQYVDTPLRKPNLVPSSKTLLSVGTHANRIEVDEHVSEIYKIAFLQKTKEWEHEEEIRVVKSTVSEPYFTRWRKEDVNFKNQVGNWTQIQIAKRPIYCLSLPFNAFREIHLGSQFYNNNYKRNNSSRISAMWAAKGITVIPSAG